MDWLTNLGKSVWDGIGTVANSTIGQSALGIAEQYAAAEFNKQSNSGGGTPTVVVTGGGSSLPSWVIPASIGGAVGLIVLILVVRK